MILRHELLQTAQTGKRSDRTGDVKERPLMKEKQKLKTMKDVNRLRKVLWFMVCLVQ